LRPRLVWTAALAGLLLDGGSPEGPAAQATAPEPPAANGGETVQAAMRNVDFHVDETIVLHIRYLRGQLVPTSAGAPVSFDDKRSFHFAVDSLVVELSGQAMADLLNRYVFAYPGAPLRSLRISIEDGRLRQRGRMNGMPVSLLSDVRLTPAGELRLTPVSIKAFGIPVKKVMSLLGMRLAKIMDLRKARGVRVDGNDVVIDPTAIVPPPAIRGRLTSIVLGDTALRQVFRSERQHAPTPLIPAETTAVNYMYYRGGTLRFGRLTMYPADLLILDQRPEDPFDFFLDRYTDQLVRGYSRNTREGGLITVMPDWRRRQ
jgi:hypothetical protein